MKAWRVMVNDLKRGTDVLQDGFTAEKEAKKLCRAKQRSAPEQNFFVQQYEEARVGRNVLSETST